MNVLLTFDVEVWCNGWHDLDKSFPSAFRRYVYGTSRKGDFALPRILETLNRHGVRATFFVEPMFAARFGLEYLGTIVDMVQAAGQDVQLHLHPEWTDEIRPCPLPENHGKRQHLQHYARQEQRELIRFGLHALKSVGARGVTAFRAGSFAANEDTFAALVANGIKRDSSVNATFAISVPDLRHRIDLYRPSVFCGVEEFPLGVFRDGFGRERHAQIGACSSSEITCAIESACLAGCRCFVLLAHNFELLRPGSCDPDPVVVRRFEDICRFLKEHAASVSTEALADLPLGAAAQPCINELPRVPRRATVQRYSEQLMRRWQAA